MILAINDMGGYGNFWGNLGMEVVHDVKAFMEDPKAFQLVAFTGGEDVSPKLYGHINLNSHNSERRDEQEVLIFEMAKKHDIPMTGICRGSQFLNVMCGGTMVQHLKRGHGGSPHGMIVCEDEDGDILQVTSTHHQMSVLGAKGVLMGVSSQSLHLDDLVYDGNPREALIAAKNMDDRNDYLDVTEAFAYPAQHVFAVQHHPEYQDLQMAAPQWTLQMIREICFEEKVEVVVAS